jgi:hypothetical protein
VSARRGERGVALLVLLVMLVVVETAYLLLAMALAVEARAARGESLRRRLDVLADSALEAAVAGIAAERPGDLPATALGGGEISAEVEEIEAGRFRVVARGVRGGLERAIAAEVRRDPWGRTRVVAWRPLPFRPLP